MLEATLDINYNAHVTLHDNEKIFVRDPHGLAKTKVRPKATNRITSIFKESRGESKWRSNNVAILMSKDIIEHDVLN